MAKNYDLGQIEGGATGMDALFASDPQLIAPVGQTKTAATMPQRIKVGSLQQLSDFHRLSAETLVHKSTQDLWALKREGEDYVIERLFQDDGQPLKG